MQSYWLLGRRCSSYTEADLVLGIFDSHERGNQSMIRYKQVIQHELCVDLHQQQGYQTVDLDDDLYLVQLKNKECGKISSKAEASTGLVYILLACCEAMGQIAQGVDFVTSDVNELIQRAKLRTEEESQRKDGYTDWFKYDAVPLNHLRFENHNLLWSDERVVSTSRTKYLEQLVDQLKCWNREHDFVDRITNNKCTEDDLEDLERFAGHDVRRAEYIQELSDQARAVETVIPRIARQALLDYIQEQVSERSASQTDNSVWFGSIFTQIVESIVAKNAQLKESFKNAQYLV